VARPLRITYPTLFCHVASLGVKGSDLFKSKCDGNKFLNILIRPYKNIGIYFLIGESSVF